MRPIRAIQTFPPPDVILKLADIETRITRKIIVKPYPYGPTRHYDRYCEKKNTGLMPHYRLFSKRYSIRTAEHIHIRSIYLLISYRQHYFVLYS